jgi:hypothetical protein
VDPLVLVRDLDRAVVAAAVLVRLLDAPEREALLLGGLADGVEQVDHHLVARGGDAHAFPSRMSVTIMRAPM